MEEWAIQHFVDLGPGKGKVNAVRPASLEVAEIAMTHFARKRIRILGKPE
jgi:hypothetical protein